MKTISVRFVSTIAEVTECYLIRTEVFVVEQQVDPLLELDLDDRSAWHFLLQVDEQAVGTCRVVFHDNEAKIGRFAIRKSHRGLGLGRQLLQFAERYVKEHRAGITRFYLGAQVTAIPFYQKLGYVAYGPHFDDAGIDHRMMEKQLSI